MENDHIRTILNNIENGTLTASEAYAQLKLAQTTQQVSAS